jgi:thiol-disulfide isomerase/thioredoxin
MRTRLTLVLALAAGLFIGERATAEVAVGDRVANLTFKDIHFLPRSLDDFSKKKAFVLVFTTTSCPLVQHYLPVLKELEKEYQDKGVQFLAVNVGADDTVLTMAAQAVQYGVEFPFVKDFDGKCAETLGVRRTPEVVVLDEKRAIRYRGRIDDQYRLVGTRADATHRDLKEAIGDVLAGREVAIKETPVDGCLISRPASRKFDKEITFAEHIAPLLQKHCQGCHRPGTSAPFALLTYKQVAAKGDMIAEVVSEQRMPPWYASPEHGRFINRRVLTSEERETVAQWVRSGMPKGDDAKLPTPPPGPEEDKWLIGKPDLILKAPLENLPATGDIPYKYPVLWYVFPEDTWVQGVQILPDNRRAVHHCNMAYVSLKEGFKESNFITGFVPGGSPMILTNGVAFRIPKGTALALQIHYVTTGKEEKCQVSVGIRYARGTVNKRLHHVYLVDRKFAIPPGASAHPVKDTKVIPHDAIALGLFAHMHLRGKDMSFTAQYPDGKKETLLVIPNYSFDWQIPYVFEPGKKRFPKGTQLECLAHYDNSTFNPFNPDATATVREGPQTYHEMMNGFFFYVDAEENLKLKIDPKTGRAVSEKKENVSAKAATE